WWGNDGRADIVFSRGKITYIWELKSDGEGRQAEAAGEVQHYIQYYKGAHPNAGIVEPGPPIEPASEPLGTGRLKVYSPNPSRADADGAILYGRDDGRRTPQPERPPDWSPYGWFLGSAAIMAAIAAAARGGRGGRGGRAPVPGYTFGLQPAFGLAA